MDQEKWNSYYIPGTDTFKNKLGIINKNELLQTELSISLHNLTELNLEPVDGNFDKEHLCEIHRRIFGDIYPWAGEFRIVSIAKANFTHYAEPDQIEKRLDDTLKKMNEKIFECNHDLYSYSMFLAEYYKEIYEIHPFREGNSRTLREFFREFILKYMGYEWDFTKVDKVKYNEAIFGPLYGSGLEMIFLNSLVSSKELEGESR